MPLEVSVGHVQTISNGVGQAFLQLVLDTDNCEIVKLDTDNCEIVKVVHYLNGVHYFCGAWICLHDPSI